MGIFTDAGKGRGKYPLLATDTEVLPTTTILARDDKTAAVVAFSW